MIKLKIITDNRLSDVKVFKGEKLSDVLRREDIGIIMPCGGKGKCGKCRVKVEEGNILASEQDKKFFSDEELKDGWRLGCCAIIEENAVIRIEENNNFNILNDYFENDEDNLVDDNTDFGFGAAVDIGTTTICLSLINLINGKTVNTISMLNSQTKYGSDVISRITAANEGNLKELNKLILEDILDGIKILTEKFDSSLLNKIVISGNTAMVYFLLGMDCTELGQYPFSFRTKDIIKMNFENVFKCSEYYCPVVILPSVSAFVGGDIVSGGVLYDFAERNNTLLIDIGTNGEMLLNASGKLFSTSVAAGPAFEGGNISCGIGGVEGAVNHIEYNNGTFNFTTIGDKKPVGICGSGVIDIISEIIKNNIADKTGLLNDHYFDSGIKIAEGIVFTQQDIRQFQMAKGALRAGIECLINRAEIKKSDINEVLISGGFGFFADIENLINTGAIPPEFTGKIKICGNTSLGGAIKLLKNKNYKYADYIAQNTSDVVLAKDDDFSSMFIEYMNF